MFSNLVEEYNGLIDKGISILDLYIYDCIINSMGYLDSLDSDIEDLISAVKKTYLNSYNEKSVEYCVDKVLYKEEEDDEDWV